jgi:hypothetical protein
MTSKFPDLIQEFYNLLNCPNLMLPLKKFKLFHGYKKFNIKLQTIKTII